MSDSGPIEETIFIGARELSKPHERAAYLDRACGGDHALRDRVERMLNAEKNADHFFSNNPVDVDKTALVTFEGGQEVGMVIGRYKLLQQLGEGGCGIVYMAEQEHPIRRRVALKVIKPGMDSKQVIARFEAERQALALMDHPNIAKVLDAGTIQTQSVERRMQNSSADSPLAARHSSLSPGRPYFVMELVRGIRITDYCDQNNLTTQDRLNLFVKVVQAVQHAHQKGIIHRDIKPSNILVTLHDGVPVPKVIDFGIAKALEQKLTDKTLFTQFEQFIGTPAYTSPEQAEMSGLDVDTRSDIYSLGVLLYELLVGKTPFDAQDLVHSGLDEMRRIIREQEPARPSTRLRTMLQGEITTTAQRRRVSVPELVHQLKGDLDWIVIKCLEKDRTRRYDTANALGSDIEHYLGNEPITARPPSTVYRVNKLVRRNRLVFAAGTAVMAALVIAMVASVWQATRAHRAEQAAKEEKDSAEAVLQFFRNKVLAASRPEGQFGGLGRDVTLRQAIDAAEAEIGKSFTDRPLVEASIRLTLGDSYRYLGEQSLAIQQTERALELRRHVLHPDHPEVLAAMHSVADSYMEADRHSQAVALFEETLRLRKAKLGPDHLDTIQTMSRLGRAYFVSWHFHLDTPWDKCAELLKTTLELRKNKLGLDHPDTLKSMVELGEAYGDAGKNDEARSLLDGAIKSMMTALGPEHVDTLHGMYALSHVYMNMGKQGEALRLNERTLEIARRRFGPEHPTTLWNMWHVSRKLSVAQALPLLEEVLKLTEGKKWFIHLNITAMGDLVWAYRVVRKPQQAMRIAEERLKKSTENLAPDHHHTLWTMNQIAELHYSAGSSTKAEALYREILGRKNDNLSAITGLVRVLLERAGSETNNPARARERAAEAEQLARGYLAKARINHTNDPAKLEDTLLEMAEVRFRLSQYAEAEPLYHEALQSRRARLESSHKEVISAAASFGRLLADWAWAERNVKPETDYPKSAMALRAREAERLLRECLAMHLKGANHTHWRVEDVRSRLGGALVSVAVADPALDAAARNAKLTEAETLLLEGSKRLRSTSAERKYSRDALERLTRLYEAWGKSNQLAMWRQELDVLDQANSASSAPAAEAMQ